MELGVGVYLLVVFVGGGLAFIACAIYLIVELVIRRRPWQERSDGSKMVLSIVLFFALGLLAIPTRMIWSTRNSAVPGKYTSQGVWGNATLEISHDGSFTETWHFNNEYSGKPEGDGTIQGRWQSVGRDWLTQDIVLKPFRPLAEYARQQTSGAYPATVTAYSGSTAIEADAGADIVFRRSAST
ncbi:MAG TPA: hypothetical protein VN612_17520 [Acidobacteriaceae bacterium]|nr:hypothetical protein [Acidobacteriaceae bacterium]